MKYTALSEGLVTHIALSFACAIFATRLSPQAVYFIQTGSSALSDTYCEMGLNNTSNSVICNITQHYCIPLRNMDIHTYILRPFQYTYCSMLMLNINHSMNAKRPRRTSYINCWAIINSSSVVMQSIFKFSHIKYLITYVY